MRVAVFSDVHGNMHALDAVLTDIARQDVDRLICLGDLVGYGAFPNEVIQTLRERDIATIMGNYDDGVGFDRGDCGCAYRTPADRERGNQSLLWTQQQVSDENKAFLRGLPLHLAIEVHGLKVRFVHGSPRRINEYLFEDRPPASFERTLDAAGADVLVCGHTHIPYHRIFGGRHVVNDGSVGKPKHGDPRACYAVLELNGGVVVEFHFVDYDHRAAALSVEAAGLPREFAEVLTAGQG